MIGEVNAFGFNTPAAFRVCVVPVIFILSCAPTASIQPWMRTVSVSGTSDVVIWFTVIFGSPRMALTCAEQLLVRVLYKLPLRHYGIFMETAT